MREWNAETYHRVSDPQVKWGLSVLARLPLSGDELVVDIGCGTGRLTEKLVARLPRGRVVAIDLSSNMLIAAREFLGSRFGGQVRFVRADAAALPLAERADAVFSTATFHWVRDHDRLFRNIHAALRPGGRLVAQCGGGPNLRRLHERCGALMRQPRLAAYFATWISPWEFADADTTAARLRAAGFVDIVTSVEPSPVLLADASAYREFVTNVICHRHLEMLPHAADRALFIDTLTAQAAADDLPFELDYWRLNLDARRSP